MQFAISPRGKKYNDLNTQKQKAHELLDITHSEQSIEKEIETLSKKLQQHKEALNGYLISDEAIKETFETTEKKLKGKQQESKDLQSKKTGLNNQINKEKDQLTQQQYEHEVVELNYSGESEKIEKEIETLSKELQQIKADQNINVNIFTGHPIKRKQGQLYQAIPKHPRIQLTFSKDHPQQSIEKWLTLYNTYIAEINDKTPNLLSFDLTKKSTTPQFTVTTAPPRGDKEEVFKIIEEIYAHPQENRTDKGEVKVMIDPKPLFEAERARLLAEGKTEAEAKKTANEWAKKEITAIWKTFDEIKKLYDEEHKDQPSVEILKVNVVNRWFKSSSADTTLYHLYQKMNEYKLIQTLEDSSEYKSYLTNKPEESSQEESQEAIDLFNLLNNKIYRGWQHSLSNEKHKFNDELPASILHHWGIRPPWLGLGMELFPEDPLPPITRTKLLATISTFFGFAPITLGKNGLDTLYKNSSELIRIESDYNDPSGDLELKHIEEIQACIKKTHNSSELAKTIEEKEIRGMPLSRLVNNDLSNDIIGPHYDSIQLSEEHKKILKERGQRLNQINELKKDVENVLKQGTEDLDCNKELTQLESVIKLHDDIKTLKRIIDRKKERSKVSSEIDKLNPGNIFDGQFNDPSNETVHSLETALSSLKIQQEELTSIHLYHLTYQDINQKKQVIKNSDLGLDYELTPDNIDEKIQKIESKKEVISKDLITLADLLKEMKALEPASSQQAQIAIVAKIAKLNPGNNFDGQSNSPFADALSSLKTQQKDLESIVAHHYSFKMLYHKNLPIKSPQLGLDYVLTTDNIDKNLQKIKSKKEVFSKDLNTLTSWITLRQNILKMKTYVVAENTLELATLETLQGKLSNLELSITDSRNYQEINSRIEMIKGLLQKQNSIQTLEKTLTERIKTLELEKSLQPINTEDDLASISIRKDRVQSINRVLEDLSREMSLETLVISASVHGLEVKNGGDLLLPMNSLGDRSCFNTSSSKVSEELKQLTDNDFIRMGFKDVEREHQALIQEIKNTEQSIYEDINKLVSNTSEAIFKTSQKLGGTLLHYAALSYNYSKESFFSFATKISTMSISSVEAILTWWKPDTRPNADDTTRSSSVSFDSQEDSDTSSSLKSNLSPTEEPKPSSKCNIL
ncbi:MAG TPA: hypothetical protein QF353_02690 [Gammaproteobacteria bacterium]|nr:hypothetical protein [Gammaproteobacteria bacterium]